MNQRCRRRGKDGNRSNAHRATRDEHLARLDEMILHKSDAPSSVRFSFALVALLQTEVEELLLLEEVDASVGRADDGERGRGRGVELRWVRSGGEGKKVS